MTDGRVIVTLGAQEYPVVPQQVGYILNQLGEDLSLVLEQAMEGEDKSTGVVMGAQAHGILTKLIPAYEQPLHEFLGFASEEAMETKAYDKEKDKSPLLPEISHAIKMAAQVNVGEGLDFLRAVVGPELLQKAIQLLIATMAEDSGTSSGEPASSPSPNGASASTSSGTPAPTSTPNEE